jgi:hypothetical protein
MALTFATIKTFAGYKLHGPIGLRKFFDSTKYFDKRASREPLGILEYGADCEPYTDENVSINPVVIYPNQTNPAKRKLERG